MSYFAKDRGLSLKERITNRAIPEPNTGCWLWTGFLMPNGYGVIRNGKGRRLYAHRAAYQEFVGPIPEGLYVCHKCDIPSCVNPRHLFVGTQIDNMRDCVSKGRQVRGSRHGASRLTEEQVLTIRRSEGTLEAIAQQFGVSWGLIGMIRRGDLWRHVP